MGYTSITIPLGNALCVVQYKTIETYLSMALFLGSSELFIFQIQQS